MKALRKWNLPSPYCEWLDPNRPLGRDVHFFPRAIVPWYDLVMLVCLGGILGSMSVLLVVIPPRGLTPEEVGWPFFLILGTVIVAMALVPLLLLRRFLITCWAWYASQCGRLRLGVFVGMDALLVRIDVTKCYLIPYGELRDIYLQPPTEVYTRRQRLLVFDTVLGRIEYFDTRLDASDAEIKRALEKLAPNRIQAEQIERADRELRDDPKSDTLLLGPIVALLASFLAVFAGIGVAVVAGEGETADYFGILIVFGVLGILVSALYLFLRLNFMARWYRRHQ